MINIVQARARLATIIGGLVDAPVKVYPSPGWAGTLSFPGVVVGMPYAIEAGTTFCVPGLTWPIACVVARPGSYDADPISQLDALWPHVYQQLREQTVTDKTLGGICSQSAIQNPTVAASLDMQGQSYPAYFINLNLYG